MKMFGWKLGEKSKVKSAEHNDESNRTAKLFPNNNQETPQHSHDIL